MASKFISFVIVSLIISLALPSTLGGIECENLSTEICSFAVSSSSKRCVLERHVKRSGEEAYTCKTSEIEADKLKDHIESDQCIKACDLDRKSLGISSDSLLESRFTEKLCSPQCYKSCPNIVDLYFNLAAGEGVLLPKLCEAKGGNARRRMAELKSYGYVAPRPVHSVDFTASPPQPLGHVKFADEPVITPACSPYYEPEVAPAYPPYHEPEVSPAYPPYHEPEVAPAYPPYHEPEVAPAYPPYHEPEVAPAYPPYHEPEVAPAYPPYYEPEVAPAYPPYHEPEVDPAYPRYYEPEVAPAYPPYYITPTIL